MDPRQPGPAPVPLGSFAPPVERADAARNRARVMAAAGRLFTARGVAGVTMDDIAAEAGVGKGTLYRRFGDKGGLATALLDERERELQHLMLTGPPPLGPGADPVDRLVAFVEAYLRFVLDSLDLLEMSETNAPGARFRSGAYALWATHCRILFGQAGATDADLRAQILLAALSAEQVRAWTQDQQRNPNDITRGLVATTIALADGHASAP